MFFNAIPQSIKQVIFNFLPVPDKLNCQLVSKPCNEAINSNLSWQSSLQELLLINNVNDLQKEGIPFKTIYFKAYAELSTLSKQIYELLSSFDSIDFRGNDDYIENYATVYAELDGLIKSFSFKNMPALIKFITEKYLQGNINAFLSEKYTLLHWFTGLINLDGVNYLIDKGAQIDSSQYEYKPIYMISFNENLENDNIDIQKSAFEIIKIFNNKGADLQDVTMPNTSIESMDIFQMLETMESLRPIIEPLSDSFSTRKPHV